MLDILFLWAMIKLMRTRKNTTMMTRNRRHQQKQQHCDICYMPILQLIWLLLLPVRSSCERMLLMKTWFCCAYCRGRKHVMPKCCSGDSTMGLLPNTSNCGCACARNAGNVFPATAVSNPDMHHGTCVTHVPWCMPGSLTRVFLWIRRRGNTFPAFPAHAQPAILRFW